MMDRRSFPNIPELLGTSYGRNLSAVFAATYNGDCPTCFDVTRSDELVVTIRTNGGPGVPSTPITDTAFISSVVRLVIQEESPVIVVWGNENNSKTFYTGTGADYRIEYTAACEAAHSVGLLCANDGPTYGGVVYAAIADFIETGMYEEACIVAEENLEIPQATQICVAPSMSLFTPQEMTLINKMRDLLPVYAEVGDLGNFHWYGKGNQSFAIVYTWFKLRVNKPVIVGEWGLRELDTNALRLMMEQMIALRVPVAIYWSVYGAQAIPLYNTNNTLNAMGLEFQAVVQENFP